MATKLAFLLTHPIQYFSPVFRELAKQPEIDLTVLYCSRHGLESRVDEKFGVEFAWDIPLLEGYKSKFLKSIPRGDSLRGALNLFNLGIVRELRVERYEAIVVHGYTYPTHWLAFSVARLCGTKTFLRGDAHVLQQRTLLKRILKQLILRPLFKALDGFLTVGRLNRQYYQRFGVSEHKMFLAPHCVDNDFFAKGAEEGASNREKILSGLNLEPDLMIFSFVGKLYPRKAPFDLLAAFEKLKLERGALLFVGDGESRGALQDYVATRRVSNVRFTGFVNQSELPKYYGITDVLVMPSLTELWGLVVNEAMACDCAVVVSDACQCAPDLVHEGENGRSFPAGDVGALAEVLHELADDPERVRAMGRMSREIIKDWSPEICAQRIAQAVQDLCR